MGYVVELTLAFKAIARRFALSAMLAVQIVLAFIAISNCLAEVHARLSTVFQDTGIDTSNIVVVEATKYADAGNTNAGIDSDLAAIASVAGVRAVTVTDSVPMGGIAVFLEFRPEGVPRGRAVLASYMKINEQGLPALGLPLRAGREFRREEIGRPGETAPPTGASVTIVSADFAHAIFGSGDVVGKTFIDEFDRPYVVVGVTASFIGQQPMSPSRRLVIFRPVLPAGPSIYYVARVEPGSAARVANDVRRRLEPTRYGRAILRIGTMREFAGTAYQQELETAGRLGLVGGLTLIAMIAAIAATVMLAAERERRSNGIKRALGATRTRIWIGSLSQNLLVVMLGALVAVPAAILVNRIIRSNVEFSALTLGHLVTTFLFVLVIAQLAALVPAVMSARVNPATAIRTA